MSNKHITHTNDSRFNDISITSNNWLDDEHKLTFHNDNGMSVALRLDDAELDQLVETLQSYKNERDGIDYDSTLDTRDTDITVDIDSDTAKRLEHFNGGLTYTEEEKRVLSKFYTRNHAEIRSIIFNALQSSVDIIRNADSYETINGAVNITTSIITANLLENKH